MRATVHIPDHLRAAVMAVAARRGYRGYSRVIVEALEFYLAEKVAQEDGLADVLAMKGTWSAEEGEDTRARIADVRSGWRTPGA